MVRRSILGLMLGVLIALPAWGDEPPSMIAGRADLATIRYEIVKTPKFQATPQYSLLVVGMECKATWIVWDEDAVYCDLNHDGDLTQENEKFAFQEEDSSERSISKSCTVKMDEHRYLLLSHSQHFRNEKNPKHKNRPKVKHSFYMQGDQGVGRQALGGFRPHADPAAAPITHFAGPLSLQCREFKVSKTAEQTFAQHLFASLATHYPGVEKVGLLYRVAPKGAKPVLEVTYKNIEDGTPFTVSHVIEERC